MCLLGELARILPLSVRNGPVEGMECGCVRGGFRFLFFPNSLFRNPPFLPVFFGGLCPAVCGSCPAISRPACCCLRIISLICNMDCSLSLHKMRILSIRALGCNSCKPYNRLSTADFCFKYVLKSFSSHSVNVSQNKESSSIFIYTLRMVRFCLFICRTFVSIDLISRHSWIPIYMIQPTVRSTVMYPAAILARSDRGCEVFLISLFQFINV